MKVPNKYTTPKLVKGKVPEFIPKGSTLEKEMAKNTWYINYSFNGKQIRIKEDLNRIKDPKAKAYQADVKLKSIIRELETGFNPEKPEEFFEELRKQSITIADAVNKYMFDSTHLRPKSVGSYRSNLFYLVEAYPGILLKVLTKVDLEKYIYS